MLRQIEAVVCKRAKHPQAQLFNDIPLGRNKITLLHKQVTSNVVRTIDSTEEK